MREDIMPNLFIRRATEDDLQPLLALLGQPDMDGDRVIPFAEAQEIFRRVSADAKHEIYIALNDSEVIATFTLLIVHHLSHRGARSLIIEDVVVQTDWQGKGIGRQMMQFAVARGKQLHCYKLALSSGLRRERAHEFYEHLGFQKHGFSFLLPLDSPTPR
jgi:GNAT superfamily N-acetyltransferase